MAQYGKVEYWNERYTRDPEPFDWFQRWSGLRDVISGAIGERQSRLLVVGCGNSRMSDEMLDDGYTQQVNIDASDVVIEQCKERYEAKKGLNYETVDVTDMRNFQSASFDAVIDKGTLDSLVCGEGESESANRMVSEVQRVLRPQGVFVCVSYGKPEYRLPYLECPETWRVDVKTVPRPKLLSGTIELPEAEGVHYIYICRMTNEDAA